MPPAVTSQWTESTLSTDRAARSFQVINWSGGFAALRAVRSPAGLAFWTSPDGTTWRKRALPFHGSAYTSLRAFGSGLLLAAVGYSSQEHVHFAFWTWRSDEGWTPRGGLSITAPPHNEVLVRFAVRPGRWLVYGGIFPVVCCGGVRPGGEALSSGGSAAQATT